VWPGARRPGLSKGRGRRYRRARRRAAAPLDKTSAWPHAVRAIDAEGLHFHDLRHTGNHLAAVSGAGLRDLMARMGHDSERAAIFYQHRARGADELITTAIDAHIQAEQTHRAGGGQGDAGGIRTGG